MPSSIHASTQVLNPNETKTNHPHSSITNINKNDEEWRHGSVMVEAGENTKVYGIPKGQPLPLGIPFEFESNLFKGRMLLRFRNVKSDDTSSHEKYFEGRKRLMQTVVQGRFKKGITMDDLYVGSVFEEPLAGPPPPSMTKIMDAVLRRVAPGVIIDLGSKIQPRVLALYAGSAQTMRIDTPGTEPDITIPDIPENISSITRLGDKMKNSISKRKKYLSIPKKASKYEFDTDHIYTFHTYDDAMDYGRGTMKIPMYGDYDIKPYIGSQPLSLSSVTTQGDVLYNFRIWHKETSSVQNSQ